MLWLIQTPPIQVAISDPGPRISELEKAQQWAALADYFETLTPKQRGANLNSWLKALQKSGRWPRLLEICDAVIPQLEAQSGPQLSIPRLERAQALSALNRHAEAEAAHEQNGKLGHADGFFNACVEARNALDWPGLERCSEEMLAAKPTDPQALGWKGEALARQERFLDAEPLLRQALQGDPSQAMAWNNLGRCLNAKRAWAEAVDALSTSIDLNPNEWEAHYNRGMAELRLGRNEDGLKDLRAAVAGNPVDAQIRKDLAEAEAYVHPPAKTGHRASAR
jgi:tetratricopeptide (TPR) repeat protein